MAFNEHLDGRIREHLSMRDGVTEKKMFGGIAFLLNGNMCCGVLGDEMIVRLDPKQADEALDKPHTRIFDFSSRPMEGWIYVHPSGINTEASLAKWVESAVKFASSLPAK